MPPSHHLVSRTASKAEARQFEMDVLVGHILLYGVMLSLLLICSGLIWRWFNAGNLRFDYELSGMNLFQLVAAEMKQALHAELRPRLLLSLGIAVLMLTPFIRVLASVFYFLIFQKNWKYALFTSLVLIVLTYSLFLR
ncbi:MAG TPA: DUF1634 domain-containing protein [Terriglobales bacterium]|nr:DUF1634 domain-containing protein [Terriglobales bacterium]